MDVLQLLNSTDTNLIALTDGSQRLTYKELVIQVKLTAAWLKQQQIGVIAIHAKNSPQWVIYDLACQFADIVCLPLPEFFSKEQIEHCLQSAQVDLLITDTDSQRITRKSDDNSMPIGTKKITFTSGSTGNPKGVCLNNEHQWQVAESLAQVINIDQPKHLCLLPFSTLLENIAGVYAPLICSGEVIIPPAKESGLSGSSGLNLSALTRCISHHQPHSMILIPQLLSALISACEHGWQPPLSLKFVAVGGAKVDEGLIKQTRDYGIPVYEGYGLSECASVVALNTPQAERTSAAGKVLPHCEVTVKDKELVIAGSCFLGYLGQPESWYPKQITTGDLGSITNDFIDIEGRRKNLIISSYGRNVSPEWVESKLLVKTWLQQCVVIGEGRPYLSALLLVAEIITDQNIDDWISKVNQGLPDYAQVLSWIRVPQANWSELLTANGRVKRQLIQTDLVKQIDDLYKQTPDRYQRSA